MNNSDNLNVYGWKDGTLIARSVTPEQFDTCVQRVWDRVHSLTPHQKSRVQHWRDNHAAQYIGRANRSSGLPATKWANPYNLKDYPGGDTPGNRYRCLAHFIQYIIRDERLMAALPELKGKSLGCWCRHAGTDILCHGLVLIALVLPLNHHDHPQHEGPAGILDGSGRSCATGAAVPPTTAV